MSESDSKVIERGPEDILQAWLDHELRKLQESPPNSVEQIQAAVEALRLAAPSAIEQLRQRPGWPDEPRGLGRDRGAQDPLTGVGNRRGVEERLAIEWERSRRYGRPLTVVALEVSQPKGRGGDQVRQSADAALLSGVNRLLGTLRASDFLGRIVGEEFVLICPEVDEAGAEGVATKVVDVITGGRATGAKGRDRSLKVSAGWATLGRAQTAEELLRQADRALYGRDDSARDDSARDDSARDDSARDDSARDDSARDDSAMDTRPTLRRPVPRQPRDEQAERAAHYKWMERV